MNDPSTESGTVVSDQEIRHSGLLHPVLDVYIRVRGAVDVLGWRLDTKCKREPCGFDDPTLAKDEAVSY